MVDQQPQVELRAGQRRRRQCVDSRGQRGPGDGDRVDLVALATLAAQSAACRPSAVSRSEPRAHRARSRTAPARRRHGGNPPAAQTRSPARPRAQINSAAKPRTPTPIVLSPSSSPVALSTAAIVCELLWVSAPSTIMGLVHILSALRMLDVQRTGLAEGAATLLSSHAEHPRPATSDTTKGGQTRRVDSLKESQLAARSGPSPSASDVTDATDRNSKPESTSFRDARSERRIWYGAAARLRGVCLILANSRAQHHPETRSGPESNPGFRTKAQGRRGGRPFMSPARGPPGMGPEQRPRAS